jgi:hypothetical protein
MRGSNSRPTRRRGCARTPQNSKTQRGIYGRQADTEEGLRPDPSALVARQLGLSLHELAPELPLYDGVSGARVSPATDAAVEHLRDVLMDAAAERVEEAGEEAVEGMCSALGVIWVYYSGCNMV